MPLASQDQTIATALRIARKKRQNGGELDDTRQTIAYRPLNFRKLREAGALRVTEPGDGRGGYAASDDPEQWSMVTPTNDRVLSRDWPDKPASYDSVERSLNQQPGPLYDGKYRQILAGAAESNMADRDIYQDDVNYAAGGPVATALRIARQGSGRKKRAASGKTDLEKSHPDYGHTTHERSFDHEFSADEAPAQETKTHEGPIISSVSGRTDHLNMNVKSGSHVLPADVVAALGEGNTLSGLKVVRDLFAIPNVKMKGLPYNAQGLPYGVTTPSRAADGGKQDGDAPFNIPKSKSVPIIAAGGEHVITPDEVEYVAKRHGSDDRDDGHAIIDAFIKQVRKNHIRTLRKLPGPAKD